MGKIYKVYTIGLALTVLVSCRLNDIEDPIIVPQVEKEFFVEMREALGPAPRDLRIHLRTVKVQDCLNASIHYEFSATIPRYRLDIIGIQNPADCIPGAAPARDTVPVNLPGPALYGIEINLKNTVANHGFLNVTDDVYSLEMDTEEGLVITNKQLRRIPEYTIWGYIGYSSPSMVSFASNFVNDLGAMSAVASFSPGHYGHFTIPSGGGQISVADSPTDLTLRTFVFRFNGNLDDLRTLVQNYRNQHGQLLSIKLLTITGESI